MKRAFDTADINNILQDEPNNKVVLVERNKAPAGIDLLNANSIAKKSYVDSMELCESVSNVHTAVQCNAKNKLDIIGRQMQTLHTLMKDVVQDTKLSLELHNVACNFVKKPGHIYHLYERPSGQKYLGMLSPEEWKNSPHNYLGSYMLEADSSWTPANNCNGRYEGVHFLQQIYGAPQMQALL